MKLQSFKKLGVAAGFVAIIAAGNLGILDKPIYELNDVSHAMFQVAAIGSNENYRIENINKAFDKYIVNKNLTAEQKEEVLILKSYIQSDEYKESLKDIEFYMNEKEFGIERVSSIIGSTKKPFNEFKAQMQNDGWDLAEVKEITPVDDKGRKIEKAEVDFHFNMTTYDQFGDARPEGKFGFFNDKKGLESYAKSREMSEPFEPMLRIQQIREKANSSTKNKIKNIL